MLEPGGTTSRAGTFQRPEPTRDHAGERARNRPLLLHEVARRRWRHALPAWAASDVVGSRQDLRARVLARDRLGSVVRGMS